LEKVGLLAFSFVSFAEMSEDALFRPWVAVPTRLILKWRERIAAHKIPRDRENKEV